MPNKEIIAEIGAEGGSITLLGVRTGDGWLCSRSVVDWTPELIDEVRIEHESAAVDSWEAALQLLDDYSWYVLSPIQIHPEFRGKMWTAVQRRLEHALDAKTRLAPWRECCAPM